MVRTPTGSGRGLPVEIVAFALGDTLQPAPLTPHTYTRTGPSQSTGNDDEDDRPPGKGWWFDVHDPSTHTSWMESLGHLPMWLQSSITVGIPLAQALHLARWRSNDETNKIVVTVFESGWDGGAKDDGSSSHGAVGGGP